MNNMEKDTEPLCQRIRFILLPLFRGFKNILESVATVGRAVKKAFANIFNISDVNILEDATSLFEKLTKTFKITEERGKKIEKIFEGIFAVADIVKMAIQELLKAFLGLDDSSSNVADGFLDVSASFGEWLKGVRDWIKEHGTFKKAAKWVADFVKELPGKIDKIWISLTGMDFKSWCEKLVKEDLPKIASWIGSNLPGIREDLEKTGKAVDTVSGNQIPNSSVNYSLVASGSNVTISAGSGQTVPSIALGINSGSLSNGSRTLTVTAGGSNTTATVTITDYSAGWTAAYGKVSLPANNTSTGFMVVETPPSTVGGNATSTTYTLDTADKNIAYIKQGSSVKAQVTHNKYNSGWTAAYNKVTLPANGTGTTMVVKTPPSTVDGNAASTTYTLSSDNNVAYIKVGNDVKAQLTHNKYSNGYTAGWHAYYNTMHFPSSGTTSTMSVYWPGYTPDSSWDSVQRDYVLSSDNNTCYLKYGSTTMAQLTHNKYTNGYNSARLSLNTSTKVISKSSSGDVTQYTLALMSDSRNTTSGSDYGKRKVWIKATPNSGSAVEVSSTTLSDYRDGWTAAYNKVSIPSSANTSTNYMTVKTPPSTVGGSADETKYYVTSDNSYAYLRKGSTAGTIVARGTNNAYGNGKSDVWNGVTISYPSSATWRYVNSSSLQTLAIYMKTPFSVQSSGMTTKNYDTEWSAVPTEIYRAGWNAGWNAFYDDSPDWIKDWDEGGGVKSVWTPRKTSSYNYYGNNGKGTGSSATCQEWFRYSSGSSPSHSISQSHAYADNLATLANNLGASSSSALTNLGTFPAAGGRNYWGIKVSCGSAVKYYYVHTT